MGEAGTISKKPLQSEVVILNLQTFHTWISREVKQFSFSLISFYHIHAINKTTVFLIYTGTIQHNINYLWSTYYVKIIQRAHLLQLRYSSLSNLVFATDLCNMKIIFRESVIAIKKKRKIPGQHKARKLPVKADELLTSCVNQSILRKVVSNGKENLTPLYSKILKTQTFLL